MIDEKDSHILTISKSLRSAEEQVLCERKQRQSLQEKVRCSIFSNKRLYKRLKERRINDSRIGCTVRRGDGLFVGVGVVWVVGVVCAGF